MSSSSCSWATSFADLSATRLKHEGSSGMFSSSDVGGYKSGRTTSAGFAVWLNYKTDADCWQPNEHINNAKWQTSSQTQIIHDLASLSDKGTASCLTHWKNGGQLVNRSRLTNKSSLTGNNLANAWDGSGDAPFLLFISIFASFHETQYQAYSKSIVISAQQWQELVTEVVFFFIEEMQDGKLKGEVLWCRIYITLQMVEHWLHNHIAP